MKTKLTALLLAAVAAFALVPKQAQAGDKEIALIGGFIGGLVIGSAINESRPDYGYQTEVVVHGGRGYGYDRYDRHDRYDRGPRGHWEHRTVRVWVPASYEFRWEYGRRVRVYIPGHYEHRTERVWVAHNRYDRHGRGRW